MWRLKFLDKLLALFIFQNASSFIKSPKVVHLEDSTVNITAPTTIPLFTPLSLAVPITRCWVTTIVDRRQSTSPLWERTCRRGCWSVIDVNYLYIGVKVTSTSTKSSFYIYSIAYIENIIFIFEKSLVFEKSTIIAKYTSQMLG